MFGRVFESHKNTTINNGTIEIQFDNDCSNKEYLLVADAHGIIELNILE